MARLEWDKPGERWFEGGVDRGVIYAGERVSGESEGVFWVQEDARGHPWNGLIAVNEKDEDRTVKSTYFDGVKNSTIVVPGSYEADIQAFTYPPKLHEFDGTDMLAQGIYTTNQRPQKTFGFTYRTMLGNDTLGTDLGYEIHLVYNLIAIPVPRPRKTFESNVEPSVLGWNFKSVPQFLPDQRPVSHLVINSLGVDPAWLASLEDDLYGSDSYHAYLPPIADILGSFSFIITDNGDGTWTATGPDVLFTQDSEQFTIGDTLEADYLDENTYMVWSQDPPLPS